MSSRIKQAGAAALVLAVFAAAWFLGDSLNCLPHSPGAIYSAWYPKGKGDTPCYGIGISHEYRSYSLPAPEQMKIYSLGFDKMVADFLFVDVLGSMTWDEVEPDFMDWVYKMGVTITGLHPRYAYVYYSLGTFLSFRKEWVDESNDIFLRGMKALPDDFGMPFYIAYNHYWEMNDKEGAAPYFAEACRRPVAPPHMCTLASRLMLQAKADPLDVARLVVAGYCINADEGRAKIIEYDFEKRVLPMLDDPKKRAALTEWFKQQVVNCRERYEAQK